MKGGKQARRAGKTIRQVALPAADNLPHQRIAIGGERPILHRHGIGGRRGGELHPQQADAGDPVALTIHLHLFRRAEPALVPDPVGRHDIRIAAPGPFAMARKVREERLRFDLPVGSAQSERGETGGLRIDGSHAEPAI